MSRAIHDEIRAEPTHDLADARDAILCRGTLFDVHGRPSAEAARQREARMLGRTDTDYAAGAHLPSRRDGKDADRPRALDHDRIAPVEAASLLGTIEGAQAG